MPGLRCGGRAMFMESTLSCGLVSLGCTKNLVDSEVMLGLLKESGFRLTHDPATADVLIVNTCTFLRDADAESLETLREMAALKRTGACKALVAAGCMVQREADRLREQVPEIDAFVGTGDFTRIVDAVRTALAGRPFTSLTLTPPDYRAATPRVLTTPSWTAYVKIAEGCNHRCSFCVIPQVRGPHRSRPVDDIVEECGRLTAEGAREIVFLSQDSTHYGVDLYGETALARLIEAAAEVEGLEWLRVLYWFPSSITDDLLTVMREHENVCPYVDLPLQHVAPEILRRMRRGGSVDEYRRLIQRLRRTLPDVALRTAFIVGYPGETEAQFEQLLAFVEEMQFDHVAVFKYSREPGTEAAAVSDQVPADIAQERYDRLLRAQQEISFERNKAWIGRQLTVLIEAIDASGDGVGRSYRDAPEVDGNVVVSGAGLHPGAFVVVEITGAEPYALHARVAGHAHPRVRARSHAERR